MEEIVKRIPVGKKYDQKTVSPTGEVPVFDQGKTVLIGYHDDEPGVAASESSPVVVFANHTLLPTAHSLPILRDSKCFAVRAESYETAKHLLAALGDQRACRLQRIQMSLARACGQDAGCSAGRACQRFGDFAAPLSRQTLRLERQIQNLRRTRGLLLLRLLSGQFTLAEK